jgi:D-arabinose 1-dehydrogenase-like Zn-dependent alcohol dehydrogenase
LTLLYRHTLVTKHNMRGFGVASLPAAPDAERVLEEIQLAPLSSPPENNFVNVEVRVCGICGTDIHLLDGDRGEPPLPCVCGHEIVGVVTEVGPSDEKDEGKEDKNDLKVGDRVGIGYQSGSCGSCDSCSSGDPQFCRALAGTILEGRCGGFAEAVSVSSKFAFPIPPQLSDATAAVLMCAGITCWTPLQRYLVNDRARKPRQRFAVVGMGGVGHVAIVLAKALGCHVTVFSRGTDKRDAALDLGADRYIDSTDEGAMRSAFER